MRLLRKRILICLLLAVHAVALAFPTPGADALRNEIARRVTLVDEFRFIREAAKAQGIRVWLFGGTASAFGHYVSWDLRRRHGDSRFQPDRFDYDYTNIFRSTQDLDLVVDGSRAQAQAFERLLQRQYPYFMGSRSQWEVRLLRKPWGEKTALLGNPDFLNQHTDSNSTGLIEITEPPEGESVVRDVRDWDSPEPEFLKDLTLGKLHYYFSERHSETSRFKAGKNPPILSVIRYLTKVFQYELEVSAEDMRKIQEVIDAFDPKRDLADVYVLSWIEKNGKKLYQHAVNVEYARELLDRLSLRQKLIAIRKDWNVPDSLAWWLEREPLPSRPLGRSGKTAARLGIHVVAHETMSFEAYESITRSHKGEPNVFISRSRAPGEAAAFGDGFYTRKGREGARGTGITIRFRVAPNAREGQDFHVYGDYVIFHNRKALRVIPESLSIGPVEYFERLVAGRRFEPSDRAILEKLKRRINRKLERLTPAEETALVGVMTDALSKMDRRGHVDALNEWLLSPVSKAHPEVLEALGPKQFLLAFSHFDFSDDALRMRLAESLAPRFAALSRDEVAELDEVFRKVLETPHLLALPWLLQVWPPNDGTKAGQLTALREHGLLERVIARRPGWEVLRAEGTAEMRGLAEALLKRGFTEAELVHLIDISNFQTAYYLEGLVPRLSTVSAIIRALLPRQERGMGHEGTDRILMMNLDHIFSLSPSVSEVRELVDKCACQQYAIDSVIERAASVVRTPADFIELVTPRRNSSTAVSYALRTFAFDAMPVFIKLKPTASDLKRVVKLWGKSIQGYFDLLSEESALPRNPTVRDILTVARPRAEADQRASMREAEDEFVERHLDEFFAAGPTTAEIKELESYLMPGAWRKPSRHRSDSIRSQILARALPRVKTAAEYILLCTDSAHLDVCQKHLDRFFTLPGVTLELARELERKGEGGYQWRRGIRRKMMELARTPEDYLFIVRPDTGRWRGYERSHHSELSDLIERTLDKFSALGPTAEHYVRLREQNRLDEGAVTLAIAHRALPLAKTPRQILKLLRVPQRDALFYRLRDLALKALPNFAALRPTVEEAAEFVRECLTRSSHKEALQALESVVQDPREKERFEWLAMSEGAPGWCKRALWRLSHW